MLIVFDSIENILNFIDVRMRPPHDNVYIYVHYEDRSPGVETPFVKITREQLLEMVHEIGDGGAQRLRAHVAVDGLIFFFQDRLRG